MLNEVTGKYGKETFVTENSFTCVRSKGGMDATLFRDYIRLVILPLYPNISNETIIENGKIISGPVILKTDSGPGRFKECEEHINFLEEMDRLGLKIILSLPNGTSVHAELDQFFGAYKCWCRTRTIDHFSEKLQNKLNSVAAEMKLRQTRSSLDSIQNLDSLQTTPSTIRNDKEKGDEHEDVALHLRKIKCVIGLDNNDLSTMINGYPNDAIEKKPFDRAFTKERIKDAFYKVGYIPFTRRCLSNPKVRHEINENTGVSKELSELQQHYRKASENATEIGVNPVFTATLPKVQKPVRKESVTERVNDLVSKNKAFSTSGLYLYMGTMVANSKEVLEAQRRLMNIKKQKEKVKEDNDVVKKVLAKVKFNEAYLMYENGEKMLLPHWKAISMWILPMDGENAPSKYNTLASIKKRLDECKERRWQEYYEETDNNEITDKMSSCVNTVNNSDVTQI